MAFFHLHHTTWLLVFLLISDHLVTSALKSLSSEINDRNIANDDDHDAGEDDEAFLKTSSISNDTDREMEKEKNIVNENNEDDNHADDEGRRSVHKIRRSSRKSSYKKRRKLGISEERDKRRSDNTVPAIGFDCFKWSPRLKLVWEASVRRLEVNYCSNQHRPTSNVCYYNVNDVNIRNCTRIIEPNCRGEFYIFTDGDYTVDVKAYCCFDAQFPCQGHVTGRNTLVGAAVPVVQEEIRTTENPLGADRKSNNDTSNVPSILVNQASSGGLKTGLLIFSVIVCVTVVFLASSMVVARLSRHNRNQDSNQEKDQSADLSAVINPETLSGQSLLTRYDSTRDKGEDRITTDHPRCDSHYIGDQVLFEGCDDERDEVQTIFSYSSLNSHNASLTSDISPVDNNTLTRNICRREVVGTLEEMGPYGGHTLGILDPEYIPSVIYPLPFNLLSMDGVDFTNNEVVAFRR